MFGWLFKRDPATVNLPSQHDHYRVVIEDQRRIIQMLTEQNDHLHQKLIEMHGYGIGEHGRALRYRQRAGEAELAAEAARPKYTPDNPHPDVSDIMAQSPYDGPVAVESFPSDEESAA